MVLLWQNLLDVRFMIFYFGCKNDKRRKVMTPGKAGGLRKP